MSSDSSAPVGTADTQASKNHAFAVNALVLGDRFRVLRLLGGGGMGLVYLAEQVSLGRNVALKVLREDLVAQAGMAERFRREALLLSSVEHPAVVRVIDFGVHAQALCLVMEYVEGKSLQTVLEQESPFSIDRTERLLSQLAQGLSAIHAQGIVHRDLKPDNVIVAVGSDGLEQARVLDFGIARLAEPDEQKQNLTQLGMVVGTPEYMSPEQALGQTLDARSDIYALGLIAFRMLTGKPAFSAPSAREVVALQIHRAPPNLIDENPQLSLCPQLVHTVESALQKDPHLRPPTAQAFLEMLLLKPLPLTLTVTGAMRAGLLEADLDLSTESSQWRALEQTALLDVPVPKKKSFKLKLTVVLIGVATGLGFFLNWYWQPEREARRLLAAQRGSEALQTIDDATGEQISLPLKQLKAAALHQVGRVEEARKMLETIPLDTPLESEALEVLADDFGQNEGRADGTRVRKLLASWPKSKVLAALQHFAVRDEGFVQWGALRFIDLEYAGQGLKLTELYVAALGSRDCGRRSIAAKRLGELRSPEAVDGLTKLKALPKKRSGLLGLDDDECGQNAAAAALRKIELDQGP
jgi:predicted Ser/Thr protein kinase